MYRRARNFDIGQISRSGQCFRLNPVEKQEKGQADGQANGEYRLIVGEKTLYLRQGGDEIWLSCGEEEWEKIWRSYFDWDTDYGAFQDAVDSEDAYMQAAIRAGGGIRILRQPLWETLVSFIISQQNNIPRIKGCVESLCTLFGEERIDSRGYVYHTFPDAGRLAALSLEDLAPCRLGYRSRYILATARMAAQGEIDLEALGDLSYEEARRELMRLPGVGKKVADCICLFALHHIEAFPVDTHIQAMLREHYPDGFPFDRYKGFAGVLQQYGFYYESFGRRLR